MSAQHSNETVQWYTPPDIVQRVRYVLGGIDLDPASCPLAQTVVQARTYYTEADDGLSRNWQRRWFCNPPGRPKLWWEHARTQLAPGVFLVYNIDALHRLQGWSRHAIALPSARIRFLRSDLTPSKAPAHGSALIGIGVDPERWRLAFTPIGEVKS